MYTTPNMHMLTSRLHYFHELFFYSDDCQELRTRTNIVQIATRNIANRIPQRLYYEAESIGRSGQLMVSFIFLAFSMLEPSNKQAMEISASQEIKQCN